MKIYLNDDKTHVDPQPHNDILWGLKAYCGKLHKVLYMCSSLWLLRVWSRDFSHDENERTACKAEQFHKMATFLTQNGNRMLLWVKTVVILWVCSALEAVLSLSAWEKSRDSTPNSQKL